MKYKATLSTRNSTGTIPFKDKRGCMDQLEFWFLEFKIDPEVHRELQCNEPDNQSIWRKGSLAISCNFHITDLNK